MNDRIEALANTRLRWLNAIRDEDVNTIVYFLTDDSFFILPHQTLINNRDSIHKWLKTNFERFHCEWLLSQVNRKVREEYVFERGRLNLSLTPRNGSSTISYHQNYLILWRQVEQAKWRIETIFLNYCPSERNIEIRQIKSLENSAKFLEINY